MKNIIIKILRWIWEFPQCLLGLILTKFYMGEKVLSINNVDFYKSTTMPSGISLGLYVIMNRYRYMYNAKQIVLHEYGHSKQSLYLGPLYLPIVGITSATWNILRRIFPALRKINYYSIWPENWADKLGRVKR